MRAKGNLHGFDAGGAKRPQIYCALRLPYGIEELLLTAETRPQHDRKRLMALRLVEKRGEVRLEDHTLPWVGEYAVKI